MANKKLCEQTYSTCNVLKQVRVKRFVQPFYLYIYYHITFRIRKYDYVNSFSFNTIFKES